MDRPTFEEWRMLSQIGNRPCATLYLPTFPGRPEEFQDHVRLKNLTERARQELLDHGLPAEEADRFAARVLSLPDQQAFWHDRNKGLAIFYCPGVFNAWRLPIALEEFVYVGRRFQLAALLPLFTRDQSYYVLALSQNRVRLFKGSRYTWEEIPASFPAGVKEGLQYAPVSGGGQVHSGASPRLGKGGSIHHGQGGAADARHDDLTAYLRLVDAELDNLLHEGKEPLLLAATGANVAAFREVATYDHLLDGALIGNVDYLSSHDLHEKSWERIEQAIEDRALTAIAEYREAAHTREASHEATEIIPAAIQGRVKTLLLDRGARLWGEFENADQTIHTHADRRHGDDDLYDRAAVETVLKHGDVYLIDSKIGPSASPIAALFRY